VHHVGIFSMVNSWCTVRETLSPTLIHNFWTQKLYSANTGQVPYFISWFGHVTFYCEQLIWMSGRLQGQLGPHIVDITLYFISTYLHRAMYIQHITENTQQTHCSLLSHFYPSTYGLSVSSSKHVLLRRIIILISVFIFNL